MGVWIEHQHTVKFERSLAIPPQKIQALDTMCPPLEYWLGCLPVHEYCSIHATLLSRRTSNAKHTYICNHYSHLPVAAEVVNGHIGNIDSRVEELHRPG